MSTRAWVLSGALLCGLAAPAPAQVPEPRAPLVVGTKVAPPFSMKGPDGAWTGISIRLWEDLAGQLNLNYRYEEMDLEDLLAGVQSNSVDAAVAAITVTSERERVMDFTHPFYITGLGIAVSAPHGSGAPWLAVLRRLLSPQFLGIVGLLGLLLIGVGFLIWLFERRRNAEHFGGNALRGIGSGFWWSAVTMTTVGYGDKAPRTVGGRLVALIWMFAGIIMISSVTAAITSALTVSKLGPHTRGPADLPGLRVAAIADSTGGQYLDQRRISYRAFPDALGALRALAAERVDAVVYDAPILKYLVKERFPGVLVVLPRTFARQDYAIAVPQGSPLRERLDRVLEKRIRSPQWTEVMHHFLGRED